MRGLACMMFVMCVVASSVWAGEEKKPVGKVAILPFLDQTGKPAGEVAQNCTEAWEVAAEQFTVRGFTGVDLDEVEDAARDLKIDLKDSETRNKEAFAKLAEKLGVDFVVSGVILDIRSGERLNFFTGFRKTGNAKVQVKVFDCAQGKYVLENVGTGQRKGGWLFPEFSKASRLRKSAFVSATVVALEPFVKKYPVQGQKAGNAGKR